MNIRNFFGPSVRIIGIFAGGNFLASAISGLSGILYSQWIGPEDLGEFSKYGILTGYLGIGLIIVHGALPRQYPYLLGQGDKDEARNISAAAKWWYLLFSWIGTSIFAVLAIRAFFAGDYHALFGWFVQIPAIWMAIYGLYLQTMYRSNSDFVKLSSNQLITSVSSFFMLIFVKLFAYWGFLGRFFMQGLINVYIHRRFNPDKVKANFDLGRFKKLAKMSLPLSIPAYIDTYLLNSTISFFILNYLGERDLGIYAWALMLQGMLMILVRAIHQIYITKITIKYGETNSLMECFKFSLKPTVLSVGASIILAILFHFTISPFVEWVAPRYIGSIPVIRILIWQMPLFASGLGLIVMTSALWYRELIGMRLAKTVFCLGIIFLLPRKVDGVATGIILSDLFYYLLGYGILIGRLRLNKI